MLIGPNSSSAYLRVGGDGGATDHSTISASNGNLHIDAQLGYALYLAWYNTNNVLIGGSVLANGNITAYSDARLKDNVQPISGALGKVLLLNGVTFTRNDLDDKTKKYAGLLAQEVEAVLPEAITSHDNEKLGISDVKAVDYNATIGLLVEAIKELKTEVDSLKTQLAQKEH